MNSESSADSLVAFEGLSIYEIAKAVTAFANGNGGRVMIGISESGNILGLPKQASIKSVSQDVSEKISPRPAFSVIQRKILEKSIIIIDVPSGHERPYVMDDCIYAWSNGAAKQASPREISRMISARVEESTRWERQPALGVDYNDLDDDQVVQSWRALLDRSDSKMQMARDKVDALEIMKVASSGRVFNSAAVLFSKPDTGLPQSIVKIGAFYTSERSEFRDSRIIQGGIFYLFDEVASFLERNLPVSSHFEGYKRHDNRLLSAFVIRESIMNALVHRDYSQQNSSIMIALHPDRLEIWNPGRLPDGISADSIASTQVSKPTNPDIANVAHMRGLVEQWGSGTGRIVSECRRSGLKDPKWETIADGVRLTISLVQKSTEGFADDERTRDFLDSKTAGQRVMPSDYIAYHAVNSQSDANRELSNLAEAGYLIKIPQDDGYFRTDKQA
ncbi:ATP-binding protein [Stenotrophomonas geniculata]|uniref:ATP-binding protein n=1 Tax=Stenotrophomonas geniculata TaxID=86188 RepID=UPI0039AF30DC